MNEWMFNDTPAQKTDRVLGVRKRDNKTNEWMNEWMFNDTPAQKTDRLLGVRKRDNKTNPVIMQ